MNFNDVPCPEMIVLLFMSSSSVGVQYFSDLGIKRRIEAPPSTANEDDDNEVEEEENCKLTLDIDALPLCSHGVVMSG